MAAVTKSLATPDEPQKALQLERQRATFDTHEMARFLVGDETLARRQRLLAIIQNDPIFDQSKVLYMNRQERLKKSLLMASRLVVLGKYLNWDEQDTVEATFLLDSPSLLHLHLAMFIPCIEAQGTQEQHEKFLKPARRFEIIGCYAQTELGHGSNVQGLETTATYIPETDEFDIHTPTLTATKWWPGGLGLVATHAIVMARLIVMGKDHGVHPFIVQIRSLKDHLPMSGIEVGDIGPKFGYNSVDNGFIRFDHCRIPHDQMLERFAQVTREGHYLRPPSDKLSYGTMIHVRQNIVQMTAASLAKGVTISLRYCAIRRQFEADKNEPKLKGHVTPKSLRPPTLAAAGGPGETAVLNYSMVQFRLFPLLAQAYALQFTGAAMGEQYADFKRRVARNDLSTLAELHATSSCLKAVSTDLTVEGVEICRRAMGGQGFAKSSGLTDFYSDLLPNLTWEGDNYMLTQQVTRYLLKVARLVAGAVGSGNRTHQEKMATQARQDPTVAYLLDFYTTYLDKPRCHEKGEDKANNAAPSPTTILKPDDLLDLNSLLRLFGHRVAAQVFQLLQQMDLKGQSWDRSLVDMYRISRAHGQYTMLRHFAHVVLQRPSSGTLATPTTITYPSSLALPLTRLCQLFGLHLMMTSDLAEFIEAGLINPRQQHTIWIRQAVQTLLEQLRPDAIALADAWSIPDYHLRTALGQYSADPYALLMESARQEPLNHMPPVAGQYDQVVKPIMNFQKWLDDGDYENLNRHPVTRVPARKEEEGVVGQKKLPAKL